MAILKSEFQKLNLQNGAIVSIIGAGEIRAGEPHIHCTLSGADDQVLHGHLHWANVQSWYVSVFVLVDESSF